MNVKVFAKAIVAGVSGGVGSLITATAGPNNNITVNEGLIAISVALGAFSFTYFIPNATGG